jgi:hypothetical protein
LPGPSLRQSIDKPVDSYKSSQEVETDIFKIMAFTDPAPPNDKAKRPVVVGNIYNCRLPLQASGTEIKVTEVDPLAKKVTGVRTSDTSTTPTPVIFASNTCSAVAPPKASKVQRGGQTTVIPFPSKPYPAQTKSLFTLLEQLNQVKGAMGLGAYDSIIKQNQDLVTQQQNLIDTVEQRVADLVTAEKSRLQTGLTSIQGMITKYNEEKARAQVPATEFETAINNVMLLMDQAKTRKDELTVKYNALLEAEGAGVIEEEEEVEGNENMEGGRRRRSGGARRKSRKGRRRGTRRGSKRGTRRSA